MILGIVLALDETHLTNFLGDKSMHAVYMTLGNISNSMQRKVQQYMWMLLAKIPTSKFSKMVFLTKTEADHVPGILWHQLFHHWMQIVFEPMKTDWQAIHTVINPDGNTCRCLAVLMAWIADLKEKYDIVGLAMNSCPRCLAGYEDLECPNPCPICPGQLIINEL
jgi:Plavaka transposase